MSDANSTKGTPDILSQTLLLPKTRVWLKAPPGQDNARPFVLAQVVSAADGPDGEVRVRLLDSASSGFLGLGGPKELTAPRNEVWLAEALAPDGTETTEADNCSLANLSDARCHAHAAKEAAFPCLSVWPSRIASCRGSRFPVPFYVAFSHRLSRVPTMPAQSAPQHGAPARAWRYLHFHG